MKCVHITTPQPVNNYMLMKQICFDKPLLQDIKTNFIYVYNQGFRKKYNIDISDIVVYETH